METTNGNWGLQAQGNLVGNGKDIVSGSAFRVRGRDKYYKP